MGPYRYTPTGCASDRAGCHSGQINALPYLWIGIHELQQVIVSCFWGHPMV